MATKKTVKKASTKAPAKKAAAKTSTKEEVVLAKANVKVTVPTASVKLDTKLPSNLINIVLAESIGTFILTLVALFSASVLAPLYVGLTLMVIVMTIGAISGAHVNPAVTFGLWTMRKLKTVLLPFYWGAQFLGAMAAVVLIGSLTNGGFSVHFDQFTNFSWGIFTVELIGMAAFMFGIAAAISRKDLKVAGKAVGIGVSLSVGLFIAGALMSYVQNIAYAKHAEAQQNATAETQTNTNNPYKQYPREVHISGATLNPAVALAVTEKTDTQLQSSSPLPAENEKAHAYTRLSLEVIAATLIGASLGGNLFLLVNYRNKEEE